MKVQQDGKCSVGVMVYNEEDNIINLLQHINNQSLDGWIIVEIIVVSSGSSDGTDGKVSVFAQHNKRVKLLKQEYRYGKSSAINLFLKEAKSKICILLNGDSVPEKNSFQILLSSFNEETVGIVGARPVPVNVGSDFAGFRIEFLWEMHHRVSCMRPKIGEMFAFRKDIVSSIPNNCAVDEAILEAFGARAGFQILYNPQAIVYLKGAVDIKEFMAQRRRIAYGHLWLSKNFGYLVSTRENIRIIRAFLSIIDINPKILLFIFVSIGIECIGRILALWDYYIRKGHDHHIWNIAKSSKGKINLAKVPIS